MEQEIAFEPTERLHPAHSRGGTHTITTTVNHYLYSKCYNEKGYLTIVWAEALRRGITAILSERGDPEYENPLQLQRKIASLALKLQELSDENNRLRGAK